MMAWNLDKNFLQQLPTDDLEERVFRDTDEYPAEALSAYRREWLSRVDHADPNTFKYCPFCKERLPAQQDPCNCGYDFQHQTAQPVIRKRRRSRLEGLVLILVGVFWLWTSKFQWPNTKPHFLIDGPFVVAILYGLYMVFSGERVRSRLMAPFDFFMGPEKPKKKPDP